MANKIYTSALNWLKTSEMFNQPHKRIPGKWQLAEYYFEAEDELIHMQEAELKEKQEIWNIDFIEDSKYSCKCNLEISLLSGLNGGNWKTTRNYITFISSEDNNYEVEFQFAIEKEQLKLLKKDSKGKIEFFGFFKRIA